LPLAYDRLTFAQPTELAVAGDRLSVLGADSELSARAGEASQRGGAVLVANQVLAELAMIDLEAPSDMRGVVVEPPSGVALDPDFLSVLMAGLDGNPLVQGATLQQLFSDVPAGTSGNQPIVRDLQSPASGVSPLPGVAGLAEARDALSADAEVYGTAAVGSLAQQVADSLSSLFSGPERATILAEVRVAADADLSRVRLPAGTSITLTSRQGRLPLTLASTASSPARVSLVLTSEELSFVATRFAQGYCRPVNPGSEDCQLTLSQSTTTLQIPVVARTSGAFTLLLTMGTPDGSVVFARSSVTVRSTAISDVALVLMVGALLFLIVWWARNVRHGRRARRLVPKAGTAGHWSGEVEPPGGSRQTFAGGAEGAN
jgi:hypothetical protein